MRAILPIATVVIVAIVGVGIFQLLSFPMPWMLGSLFGVLLTQLIWKIPMKWPVMMRNIGLLIVGTAIGQLFTLNILVSMKDTLLFMLMLNISLSVCCFGLAYLLKIWAKIPFATAITASIPGGLSQLVIFAEEQENINVAIVTFFHVIRVLFVVGLIPIIVSLTGEAPESVIQSSNNVLHNIGLILLGLLFLPIGKKLRLPVPHFLTPVLMGLLLSLFKVDLAPMDSHLLHIAQLCIGAYIGLLLHPKSLRLPVRVLIGGISSAILLLIITFIIAEGMVLLFDMDFATSYLSTAPGGMDQMGLIATALQADATQVTIFQLFRMLFIYIVILPVLKWKIFK
ncbi:AbrB family transcriptional regulator [Cytobacillus sp. FSL W7-1323]|uniref:Ammonia monooxygenase n=1 Tax=Cytobacillus kochii TaxID=859143 RepID=A0A248TGZ2_9BACI|nr:MULTISPECIES: AbrB family transcriptional regulator [Cytobacillus]ASV67463.1 ammonia monooxygenase [Cytobacillus kochii]MEA1854790.1 AbrB family transcriptional regulator [Cytobacillus sp. OWB-43]